VLAGLWALPLINAAAIPVAAHLSVCVERDPIRTRTSEGRERAKTQGVQLGRKPKLTSQQKREALARRAAGETLMEIARSYNVSFATISRLRP